MSAIKILIIVILIGITLLYIQKKQTEIAVVKSTVDGREYVVRNMPDKQEAADILATVRKTMQQFIQCLSNKYSGDERVRTLQQRFNSDRIKEGNHTSGYTTYTINKGDQIVYCLRDRDGTDQLFTDINFLIFVSLHELAHICTPEIDHTELFKKNNQWLLERAQECGIYRPIEYPVRYCGMTITGR